MPLSRCKDREVAAARSRDSTGFSVMELLVAMTLFSIMIGTAVVKVPALVNSFNRNAALQNVEFDLRRARAEAIAQGARGVVTILPGGNQYTFGIDYSPYSDPPVADSITFSRTLPRDVTFTSSEDILFDPGGYIIDAHSILNSSEVTLSQDGTTFCNGTIFSPGDLEITCGG